MTDSSLSPLMHNEFMKQAISTACQNLQRPFGSVLVDHREGEVLATAVNRSYRTPVAHSELEVIQEAARKFGGDVCWEACTLYVTAEPCPMCMSGILWTGIPRVVFGSSMETLVRLNYRHINLSAQEVVDRARGGMTCELIGGIQEIECNALFAAAMTLEEKSR